MNSIEVGPGPLASCSPSSALSVLRAAIALARRSEQVRSADCPARRARDLPGARRRKLRGARVDGGADGPAVVGAHVARHAEPCAGPGSADRRCAAVGIAPMNAAAGASCARDEPAITVGLARRGGGRRRCRCAGGRALLARSRAGARRAFRETLYLGPRAACDREQREEDWSNSRKETARHGARRLHEVVCTVHHPRVEPGTRHLGVRGGPAPSCLNGSPFVPPTQRLFVQSMGRGERSRSEILGSL
jgi:hypothetical protein